MKTKTAILERIDWAAVRGQYDKRITISKRLGEIHQQGKAREFGRLAVGFSDPDANYSASEGHRPLGPDILNSNMNAERRVFELAGKFLRLTDARRVPELIKAAQIKYLFIGVGSEISCMMNPQVCWVANRRTIWTHLVIKHADNIAKADEELELYRDSDETSEMAYSKWAAIHAELRVALTRISEEGYDLSKNAKIPPADIVFLWADAIASHLYGMCHPQKGAVGR
jgi:hypothetical protein